MRNLVEYPITKEEIIDCLERYRRKVLREENDIVPDMRPILLESAIELIRDGKAKWVR